MSKKCLLSKQLDNGSIMCETCNHYCMIEKDKIGKCGVRKNTGKELSLLVYGKALGINIDPVEKKPLYHFHPGSLIYSLGTAGCNFSCTFCQNWTMSQIKDNPTVLQEGEKLSPKEIVQYCIKNNIPSIAYTYNEPTVFLEYALDTMKLAKKAGIKNVWVSNGYMSKETLDTIKDYIDAVNIDLKSFREDFYHSICGARLQPVLENIKRFYENDIWQEVTTLVIPGYNDSDEELKDIATFIASISADIPWHISAFYPTYKMQNVQATPLDMLKKGEEIGKKAGLKYVYVGNIYNNGSEDTICPVCGLHVVVRKGFQTVVEPNFVDGVCPKCKAHISGRW